MRDSLGVSKRETVVKAKLKTALSFVPQESHSQAGLARSVAERDAVVKV